MSDERGERKPEHHSISFRCETDIFPAVTLVTKTYLPGYIAPQVVDVSCINIGKNEENKGMCGIIGKRCPYLEPVSNILSSSF
jgi:hypothetical protein